LFNNNTLTCNIHTHFNLEPAVRKNSRLPNLHNLGIHLRILLIVNLLGILAAILLSKQFSEILPSLAELSAVVQPIILSSMLSLYVLYPLLDKLIYWQGLLVILLLEMGISAVVTMLIAHYFSLGLTPIPYRVIVLAGIVTAIVLYYFYLQQRAYSPAIAEARLQALQARIRPHFLFNSINAVLSLIRSQPKRAESALEDMADLFRVLMAENRDLVPIEKEIALCKQYLNIESLRLEERLKIHWQIDDMPPDALIPPLILQPLLENAVYHGIEPLPEGGEISVSIYTKHQELHIQISNPCSPENDHHSGNKMAIKNIKERLQLHFDLEASLKTEADKHHYSVHIRMPYEK
jgi:two-component system, LytTR family, sensor histidine kinase AlgZ